MQIACVREVELSLQACLFSTKVKLNIFQCTLNSNCQLKHPHFSDVQSPDIKCCHFIASAGHPQEHDP